MGAPSPTSCARFSAVHARAFAEVMLIIPVCAVAVLAPAPAGGQCQIAKFVPDDGGPNFAFGYAVDVSGDTLVMGSAKTSAHGLAYIFERDGGAWNQAAEFEGDGTYGLNDQFGAAVAISGDAMLVGAWSENTGGAVYSYRRVNGEWTAQGRFAGSDSAPGDRFGFAVALEGNRAVVGASARNAAYVFHWDGQSWVEEAKLTAIGGLSTDDFGYAVDLRGERVLVGAPRHDAAGFNVGSAFVFDRQSRSGKWMQTALLTPSPSWPSSKFGAAVALDGGRLAVSAHVGGSAFPAGALFVYERKAGGAWPLMATLSDPNAVSGSQLGFSLALQGDLLLAGANLYRESGGPVTGASYVFACDAGGQWSRLALLKAGDGDDDDWFGSAVALDGALGLIGARRDEPLGTRSGSAYAFAVSADNDGEGTMDACDCVGDLDGNWTVDSADLAIVIANFGLAMEDDSDFNGDGVIDQGDLGIFLQHYGDVCP